MKKNEEKVTKRTRVIFPVSALLWGITGSLATRSVAGPEAVSWFFAIYLMCLFNLFCLMKSVATLQKVVSQTLGNQKTKALVGLFFWGTLKVLCLGLIGWALWKGNPQLSKQLAQRAGLLGASTMVAVPLIGGLWWSKWDQRP